MKIEIKGGVVSATAESLADAQTLIALAKPKKAVAKKDYKKVCPVCSKRVKDLVVHMRRNHNPIARDLTVSDGPN